MKCTSLYVQKCLVSAFIYFLFIPIVSHGQEFSYTNYNSKEGLAGSTVYCVQQDKEGFLWFGTETGLSRFDGTNFKNFTTADGLPDNEILRLFVDSKNRVWIVPFRNAVCYYWKGKIYNRDNDSLLRKIKINGDVRTVLEDKSGNILIHDVKAVHIIKPDGSIIRPEIDGNPIVSANFGLNNKGAFRLIWWAKNGAAIGDMENEKIKPILSGKRDYINSSKEYLLSPWVDIMKKNDSLIFFPYAPDLSFSEPVPEAFVGMVLLNDSLLAINAASKCIVYNFKTKKYVEEFLHGHMISSVLQDREKNLWFTTIGEGIFRLGSTAFKNLSFSHKGTPLSVFSIQKLGSKLYVGTNHSRLWEETKLTGKFWSYKVDDNNEHGRVLALTKTSGDKMVVGTDLGVFVFKRTENGGKVTGQYQTSRSVKYLSKDHRDQDKIIVASGQGVFNLSDSSKYTYIWEGRTTCAASYKDGYYIGTLNGLYEVNNEHSVFLGQNNKQLAARISAISTSFNDIHWIATYGEGLIALSNGKMVKNLREEDGLTSNICRNIFSEGRNLWVGTDKGLNRIEILDTGYKITRLTTADGLSSNFINTVFVDSSTVYVGTPAGITYFDENKILQSSSCVIRITGISTSESKWNFDTSHLLLSHDNNNIRFDFVALSYKSAGDISYRYRLIGLDSNWKNTRETYLSYPSLPSGKYELQLVAVNKFGVQSEMKRINFEIESLLHEKTWFRLLLLLAVAILAWVIIRYYIRGIRKKETERSLNNKKLAEMEMRSLRAQMNPHFTFNVMNSIQYYLSHNDFLSAQKYLAKFAKLMRTILDNSKLAAVNLSEEIKTLEIYLELEKLRFGDQFEYKIIVEEVIDQNKVKLPTMLIQPYAENAIKHGLAQKKSDARLTISFSKANEILICEITDNGIGRKQAREKSWESLSHISAGTSLVNERIEAFNNYYSQELESDTIDLQDEAGNCAGTKVILKIPLCIKQ